MSYGHKVVLNQTRTDTGKIDLDLSIDGLKIKPIKYSIDQECEGLTKITFTIYANSESVINIREDPQPKGDQHEKDSNNHNGNRGNISFRITGNGRSSGDN